MPKPSNIQSEHAQAAMKMITDLFQHLKFPHSCTSIHALKKQQIGLLREQSVLASLFISYENSPHRFFRLFVSIVAKIAFGLNLCFSQTAFGVTSNQATATSSLASSTETWDSQFNAYRAKKIRFLTKLREYIETDHTDVQAFREKMGDLVEGDWKFCDDKKYCYLENKTNFFESARWRNLYEIHNRWDSYLSIKMRLNQAFGDYHRDKKAPVECIRYDEFKQIFSTPDWEFVTIPPRTKHHSDTASYMVIAKRESLQRMRPQISYLDYNRCMNNIRVNFIQE